MRLADIMTAPARSAGMSVLSVAYDSAKGGLPVGLQIVGLALDKLVALQIRHALQRANKLRASMPNMTEAIRVAVARLT